MLTIRILKGFVLEVIFLKISCDLFNILNVLLGFCDSNEMSDWLISPDDEHLTSA